jgi:hypothetical protein
MESASPISAFTFEIEDTLPTGEDLGSQRLRPRISGLVSCLLHLSLKLLVLSVIERKEGIVQGIVPVGEIG